MEKVLKIQEEMGDCQIFVNIKVRGSELEQLIERLNHLNDEFKDLKQADKDFEGTADSELGIKNLISEIEKMMKGLESEKRDHIKTQNKLEGYKEEDIKLKIVSIIEDIREFKARLAATKGKLDELDEKLRDLNTKLILQDLDNATRILEKKAADLRKRLRAAE